MHNRWCSQPTTRDYISVLPGPVALPPRSVRGLPLEHVLWLGSRFVAEGGYWFGLPMAQTGKSEDRCCPPCLGPSRWGTRTTGSGGVGMQRRCSACGGGVPAHPCWFRSCPLRKMDSNTENTFRVVVTVVQTKGSNLVGQGAGPWVWC